jgi:hypothetical protein
MRRDRFWTEPSLSFSLDLCYPPQKHRDIDLGDGERRSRR